MVFGVDVAATEEVDRAPEFQDLVQIMLEYESKKVPQANTGAAVTTAAGADAALLVSNDVSANIRDGFGSSRHSFEMIVGELNESVEISRPPPSRVNQEKLRKWQEEQTQRLDEKDREEEREKKALRLQAKKELEDWLRQYKESIAKTKAASASAKKQAAALQNGGSIKPGNEWECLANLCDFNPKVKKSGKGVARMQSIYLQLKQNPIPLLKLE